MSKVTCEYCEKRFTAGFREKQFFEAIGRTICQDCLGKGIDKLMELVHDGEEGSK